MKPLVRASSATKPRSIDDYVTQVQACGSTQQLFNLFDGEIKAEGYQNVVFARVFGQPELAEVPFGDVPDGVAHAYFSERMWEHDPIFAAAQTSALPFAWIELMMRQSLSQAARRVMEVSAAHGVQGGITIPFHRPGGHCDMVSLSMRDRRLLDASRIHIVSVKTYATVQRYLELSGGNGIIFDSRQPLSGQGLPARVTHASDLGDAPDHPQHGGGVGLISDAECRALVFVDIAWRRYCAGLIALSEGLPAILGAHVLGDYVRRGLIDDEPDDLRFQYVYKPSPVGQSHLKCCSTAAKWRDEVWSQHVDVHERPAD